MKNITKKHRFMSGTRVIGTQKQKWLTTEKNNNELTKDT